MATEALKRAEAVRNKTYHCSLCDKTCGNKSNLDIHFATTRHTKMALYEHLLLWPRESVGWDLAARTSPSRRA